MCEFTVYLDGEVVARKIIKSKVKEDAVILADTAGKTVRIEKASILNVDTIMAELTLVKL